MSEQNREIWWFDKVHGQVSIPTCVLTGWYDRLIGTIGNYSGMVENGPAGLRDLHRLVVGPWGHDSERLVRRQGPLDFGPLADTTYADEAVRWFDYQLKGVHDGIVSEPPVRLFVMGENRWRSEDTWPPAQARSTEFFLHSDGSANTPGG